MAKKKPRPPKPKKPSLRERLARSARAAMGLGRLLVNDPKAFPGELLRISKRGFRSLWNARGGGLYACGFVVTFVWLESRALVDQVATADVGGFIAGQVMQVVFRFTVDSMLNTLYAFLWPLLFVGRFPAVGLISLVALYFVFPRYIKGPLTRFLDTDAHPGGTSAATPADGMPADAAGPASPSSVDTSERAPAPTPEMPPTAGGPRGSAS